MNLLKNTDWMFGVLYYQGYWKIHVVSKISFNNETIKYNIDGLLNTSLKVYWQYCLCNNDESLIDNKHIQSANASFKYTEIKMYIGM